MNILEYNFYRNMVLIFADYLFTEILFEILTDNKYEFTESTADSIKN